MNKKLHVDYGAIHASYWMLYGVTSSFASAFLLHAGYTNGEIGIILAVGNVLAVFLQPLIADFADRTRKISLLGVLQLCTILLMLLEAALFVFGHKSAALWVVFAMIIAWMTVMHPLINSLSFKLQEAGIHINFGVCRSMGSLFFSIICGILGTLVERHGVGILPVAGEMTLAALLLALFLVGRHFGMAGQGTAKTTVRAAEPAETIETIENITLIDFIRDNKVFTLMQLGIAAIYFQNSVLNNFMLQIVESVGGTSEDMGRVLAVMAFLEIPALFFFDRIRRWFCCQTLLKVAAIGFTVKILLIFVAKDITLIYAAHLLQPFSFALFLPAMVAFTDEIMRRGEAVKGQACYTMMITLSSIIASIAGGVLLDTAGAKMMLLVSTILTGVGAAMVVLLVGRIRQKNDKTQQTAA